eukprot:gnl/TRDRNA2_/TRDRNA2_151218_c0_seq2.p1 gnl/TRDRNA2_/TRDRNA2_151218_c0~~gnl/TRDRNA2_/TRDRNA2_151218_c0_seq2.p1  ORF type:complete len:156 (-),score=23.24 gnl/TRDRNA2_/TRDRNA2_151218_c0_seq2:149-616(-)
MVLALVKEGRGSPTSQSSLPSGLRAMTSNPAMASPHTTVEDRLQFLEQVEHDHSRLLTLKAKADSETYDELKSMKNDMHETHWKIGSCLQSLESDGDTEEEDEGEEEDDEPDDEATEIEDVPETGKKCDASPSELGACHGWSVRRRWGISRTNFV